MLLIDVSKPCYTRKINLEFSLKILGTFNAYLHAYIVIADYKQASQYSYWRCIKLYFFLFGIVQQTYHYYTHNL